MIDFINDILTYDFVQIALFTSMFIGALSGLIGSFVILRGVALLGDAISHAILPGVVVAYMFNISFFIGALFAGLLAAYLITRVSEKTKLNSDVSIGIIFTAFFAFGIILLQQASTAIDLKEILFGNVITVSLSNMILTVIIGLIVFVIILIFFKAFLITSFDPVVSRAFGLNVKFYNYLFMLLLTLTTVASLQTVGSILVVSMLITPAATAYLLTNRFKIMIALSMAIGAVASFIGLFISATYNISSGATIVIVLAVMFLIAFLFSPKEGLVIKMIGKRK